MSRPFLTDEERQQSKIKAYNRNKKWQIDNADKFRLYQKEYFQKNKQRLYTLKKLLMEKKAAALMDNL